MQICSLCLLCGLALGAFNATAQGTAGRFGRAPLSVFYHGMQSLGDVWGRNACESHPLAPGSIADMRGALADAINGLEVFPPGCIPFNVAVIRSLSDRLPSLSQKDTGDALNDIIAQLQTALGRARFNCDHGVNPSALFVAGLHLGAAQAYASCFLCRVPIPGAFQTVMHNHLTTAHDALVPYGACIPTFDFSQFGKVPLASMVPGEPHTHIVGIESQLLWSIALSDCTCTCAATQGITSGCFAGHPLMPSTDRNVHYNWAQQRSSAVLDANLKDKVNLLFNCSSVTDDQLRCAFADYSVSIAKYVPNANCFNGDRGAINTDYSAHREWARTKNRSQLLSNLQGKVSAAFNCLDRAAQLSFFADMSVITAKAPLSQGCAETPPPQPPPNRPAPTPPTPTPPTPTPTPAGQRTCTAEERATFAKMAGSFQGKLVHVTIAGSCEQATGTYRVADWCDPVDAAWVPENAKVTGTFTGRMEGGSLQVTYQQPPSKAVPNGRKDVGSCSLSSGGTRKCSFACNEYLK